MMLGCTVSELQHRMTAEEFGHWQAYLAEEPMPAPLMQRHADLLAAAANGPLTRDDKRLWRSADFMPDLWADPALVPVSTAPTINELQSAIGDWFKG